MAGLAGDWATAALRHRMESKARARLEVGESEGVPYLTAVLPKDLRVLFTTRVRSGDQGQCASFNLDRRPPHDPMAVDDNRFLLRSVIAASSSSTVAAPAARQPEREFSKSCTDRGGLKTRVVTPKQVHGTRVVGVAEYAAAAAASAEDFWGEAPCDGLTINPRLDCGLAATLLFADCLPIVLVGEVDMAVLHAGWRGLLAGVIQEGGRAMTAPPGLALIGPSLGPCCFAVDDALAERFAQRFGAAVVVRSSAWQHPHVDLWTAAEKALGELGVRPDHVVNPRLCTACNRDLFFSYRAEGPAAGRQACVAWAQAC